MRVADSGTTADYEAAFAALGKREVQIVVCDSSELEVQQALRSAVFSCASGQIGQDIAI